jgi:hypothetical protein
VIYSRSTPLAVIAVIALGWLAVTALVQPQDSDSLEWLSDYGEALALSKQTGRPLLVEFRCAP